MAPIILTHAAAGTAALLLGLVALRARKRRGLHTRVGDAYFAVMLFLVSGGVVIGASHPGISPFEIAVLPTVLPLLGGYAASKLRPSNFLGTPWLAWHIGGMGGSLIGLVTAGLFQTLGRVLPDASLVTAGLFAAPAVLGTVLIVRTINRRLPSRPIAPAT